MRWSSLSRPSRILAVLGLATIGAAPAPSGPVLGIKAMLFYNHTGGFSGDVTTDWSQLGNVVAGENASNATLVVVRVNFADGHDYPGARVRLVARAGETRSRVILDRTVGVGSIKDHATTVGFWLAGTGCEPLRLTATLTTPGPSATGQATVPFRCYE